MDDYTSLSMVGKGACGSVYLVRHNETKKLYALKKIHLDESRKTRTKTAVLREAKILSSLKHPHIVTYHDSFFDENEEYLCIIQDYCDGGTLEDILKDSAEKQAYIPEKEIIQWFLQIAMAVRYMHSMKVLHRDLKASNVFMNKSATLCKIGDFGIAKTMETMEVASTCVGTPCYLSPEMCQDIPYSSKADVWAIGCMLYEMLTLRPAFDANNLVSLFYKIVKGEFEPLPEGYSDEMVDLVGAVLVKSPEERPSARGVLAVPFLKVELLKFIEEKEWQLAQQRLPTRQGSRPYSTPNLARVGNFTGRESELTSTMSDDVAKRAISCRPNIINQKERSILTSAKQSCRTPRVSTIVEETDEQVSHAKRSERDHLRSDSVPSPRTQPKKVKVDDGNTPGSDSEKSSPEHKVSPSGQHGNHAPTQDGSSSEESSSEKDDVSLEHLVNDSGDRSPAKSKNSVTSYAKIDVSGFQGKGESVDAYKFSEKNQKVLRLDLSKTNNHHKDNLDFREFGSEVPRRHKIQEPMRTPRTLEPRVLIIEEEKPVRIAQSSSPVQPSSTTPVQTTSPTLTSPSPTKQLAEKKSNTSQNGSSVQSSIKETASKINNEVMNRKNKKKSPSKQKKNENVKRNQPPPHAPPPLKIEKKPEKKRSEAKVAPAPPGHSPNKHGDYGNRREVKRELVAPPSDSEEEIPEELPDWRKTSARSHSLTQTFEIDVDLDIEIPEIEEDLPNGLVAEDEDEFNDFEDGEDIEEELDEVVTVAKKACDDLESPEVTDDIVMDDRRPNTSRMIRNQCMNDLGREKYDTVRKFFENNEEPELRKIEKAVGKEHSKTIYLMTEISRKKKLNH